MKQNRTLALAALIATLVGAPSIATSQAAVTGANPCGATETSGTGKALSFSVKITEKTLVSIRAATLLSLSGPQPDWPAQEFKLPPLCEIAALKVGSDDFVLKRNSGDGPTIWAQSASNGDVVFLALGPDLPSAYTWYKKSNSTSMSPKAPSYLLTLMRPSDPVL